jgi:D-alanine-D-alanine ligase
MSNSRISVGIICGGRSPEHEISLSSAKAVAEVLNKDKYAVTLIKIGKSGAWNVCATLDDFPNDTTFEPCPDRIHPAAEIVQSMASQRILHGIDVIFPLIHGAFGEDGCLQGMLRLLNIPFVGADVLGSAVGMDKDVTKRLLKEAGLPTVDYLAARRHTRNKLEYQAVRQKLGEPFFVKPANAGSSIGISKVRSASEFQSALDGAFLFDSKVLLERAIRGREFECAILGNEEPVASCVGEVLFNAEFYSYEAKYAAGVEVPMSIPAPLPEETAAHIRQLAISAYTTLECFGFGRVDFFLADEGESFINEVNTLPCLSHNYPRLWEASGVSFPDVLDQLIQLAIGRDRVREKSRQLDRNAG